MKVYFINDHDRAMLKADVDECKERLACQCEGCSCTNTWGGYHCKCSGNQVYMKDQDTCIGKSDILS